MRLLLLSVIIITSIIGCNPFVKGQNRPAILWDKTFGGNGGDNFSTLVQTTDGGYILGGSSESGTGGDKSQNSKGSWDYWVVKLNSVGNKQWDKAYGGNKSDHLLSLQQTLDGGYILGGHSNSGISGDKSESNRGLNNEDFWVVKLDSSGNKQWDKTFGGDGRELLWTIQQTLDGGYIIGGGSTSGINGDKSEATRGLDYEDFWVVKLDVNGNKVWDKTFGGTLNERIYSLQQTSDGGYILGGPSESPLSGDKTGFKRGFWDYWVVKIDSFGTKQWDKTYGGSGNDSFTSIVQTEDKGYLLSGHSSSGIGFEKSEPSNNGDYWLIKIDSLGTKQWDKTLGGSGGDTYPYAHQTNDGGYIVGGISHSPVSGHKSEPQLGFPSSSGNDLWLLRVDSVGNKLWDRTIGGFRDETLRSLQITPDGGYILGSVSESGIGGNKTQPCLGSYDYWIIKLGPDLLGVKDELDSQFRLFPNPTTGIVNLELSLRNANKIIVYNTLGQVVFTKNLGKTVKEEPIQLDLSKEAKGVYTIQIVSEKQVLTKKVVLQ